MRDSRKFGEFWDADISGFEILCSIVDMLGSSFVLGLGWTRYLGKNKVYFGFVGVKLG